MNSNYLSLIFTLLCIGTVCQGRTIGERIEDDSAPDSDLMFCAYVGIAIEKCVPASGLPYCNGTKSPLQQCTDKHLSDLSKCKVPLLKKVLEEKVKLYAASDNVLCKNGLFKKFEADKNCWALAKADIPGLTGLVPGILTDDGCRISKMNVDIFIGIAKNIPGCPKTIEAYLKSLYKQTACGSI